MYIFFSYKKYLESYILRFFTYIIWKNQFNKAYKYFVIALIYNKKILFW